MARIALALALALVCAPLSRAQNPIAAENALPGTSEWLITNVATETDWGNLPVPGATTSSNAEVEGYASATSVNAGESIRFHVNTTGSSVQLRFFRLGWYGGLGAREITQAVVIPGAVQPPCAHEPTTHRIDCDWSTSHTLNLPPTWVTGVYLVKATSAPST